MLNIELEILMRFLMDKFRLWKPCNEKTTGQFSAKPLAINNWTNIEAGTSGWSDHSSNEMP